MMVFAAAALLFGRDRLVAAGARALLRAGRNGGQLLGCLITGAVRAAQSQPRNTRCLFSLRPLLSQVLVEGFYDGVVEPTEEDREDMEVGGLEGVGQRAWRGKLTQQRAMGLQAAHLCSRRATIGPRARPRQAAGGRRQPLGKDTALPWLGTGRRGTCPCWVLPGPAIPPARPLVSSRALCRPSLSFLSAPQNCITNSQRFPFDQAAEAALGIMGHWGEEGRTTLERR
jgi:hypothetical protein